jgi:hypothetical protein
MVDVDLMGLHGRIMSMMVEWEKMDSFPPAVKSVHFIYWVAQPFLVFKESSR